LDLRDSNQIVQAAEPLLDLAAPAFGLFKKSFGLTPLFSGLLKA